MRSTRWLTALGVAFAVACVPVAAAVAGSGSPTTARVCTTSAAMGSCGPYPGYRRITGTTSSTFVGNDVWNPIPRWHQTLKAASPGHWQVTANMPAGNTAVVSYPSIGANYGRITNVPTPLSSYAYIRSSFTEHMNATARTSAWAAYDIWLGPDGCSNCASDEVMIQQDFANNGACATVATTTFPGPGGRAQHWHLCRFGSELIWKLGAGERHKVSEQTGSVYILSMLRWLVTHRYLPAHTGLWLIGYGWEICSTGGRPETFTVSAFTLRAACKTRGCR
jgi:hypothetical protein